MDDNWALAAAIGLAAGRPRAPVYSFPWPMVQAMVPFHEAGREMREMIYLRRRPLRLLDAELRSFLNDVPATQL